MISKSELGAFQKSALRNIELMDMFRISKNYYSERFRKWRWKNGLSLRKGSILKPVENVTIAKYKRLDNWEGEASKIIRNAQSFFCKSHKLVRSKSDTFRASGGKRLPWPKGKYVYDDIQDAHAWHRLYWVLDSSVEQVLEYLRLWMDVGPDEVSIHSYTVSERIHSLSELIAENILPEDLKFSAINQLYIDATWLYDHIETRLGVHNHLLNNARALCVAAYAFEGYHCSKVWFEKARAIWDKYWPELINDDGFFSEQSSYYHILLNRTLLDYLADAKYSGRKLPETIEAKAKKMSSITNLLFRSDGTFPIFGDASPDLPMNWLRGLPNICREMGILSEPTRDKVDAYAGGASRFLGSKIKHERKKEFDKNGNNTWDRKLFKDSGFLFIRNDKINLELTAMGNPSSKYHGHCDVGKGSYEIWKDKRHIVVDGGVPEYGLSTQAMSYKGIAGQNCVSIDGIAPTLLPYEADQMPRWYTTLKKKGKWELTESSATFSYFGFYRYRSGLKWERTWFWEKSAITVSDRISGVNGVYTFNSYVHLGDDNWQRQNINTFSNDNCAIQIRSKNNILIELIQMPYSPNYGIVLDSLGVKISGKVKLPFKVDCVFEFLNNEA